MQTATFIMSVAVHIIVCGGLVRRLSLMLVVSRMGLLTRNYGTLCKEIIHKHRLLAVVFTRIKTADTVIVMVVMMSRSLTRGVTFHHIIRDGHW